MGEPASAESAEPPAKQPKTSGPVGAPPGAEADDYDSSEEEMITEQPMSKIARVGHNLRSGMAAVGAAAGSTTAPLLAALDAVSAFAQQARSASASGERVALAQADGTTVVDSEVDAQMRKISDREEELSSANIPAQRF
jgi:HAMP domain-containing protein